MSQLTYTLTVDDRKYAELREAAGGKGVTGAAFARWLGENARVALESEGAGREGGTSRLTLLIVDADGSVRDQAMVPLRASSRATPLGRAVDVAALGKVLDGLLGGSPFGPRGAPAPAMPADQKPSTFVTVVDGYRRVAATSGTEAIRANGIRTGGMAVVVIAGPDPESVKGSPVARGRGGLQIRPGGCVFVGLRPEHFFVGIRPEH